MGLTDQLMNAVNQDSSGSNLGAGNPVTLTQDQFYTSDQSNLDSGKYNLLGAFEVGAKRQAEVGQGNRSLEGIEQGRPFIDFQDGTPEPVDGDVRVRHEDPYGNNGRTIIEERTEEFRTEDKNQRIVLPRASTQGFPMVTEDSRIAIYLNPDVDGATVNASNSKVRLPITRYNVR